MFTNEEKSAMVQCFWQLLSAKPTAEESKYIEKLTSSWNLSGSWIMVAIKQEPYTAFKTVSKMSNEKKSAYIQFVKGIVNMGGDVDYKSRMANSLLKQSL